MTASVVLSTSTNSLSSSVEAPPPDITSGGYELRAAFELWGLDAAALVAGPERPGAKYTVFAPGRNGEVKRRGVAVWSSAGRMGVHEAQCADR